jgi:hypothetical protein
MPLPKSIQDSYRIRQQDKAAPDSVQELKQEKVKQVQKTVELVEKLSPRVAPYTKSRQEILAQELSSLGTYASPEDVYLKSRELINSIHKSVYEDMARENRDVNKAFVSGGQDFLSFRPASATIWNYFPNPMGVFAYLAENYWAFSISLGVWRREIDTDTFQLKPLQQEGANKAEVDRARRDSNRLGLKALRTEAAIHLKTYGNCYILPVRNGAKGLKELELLYPERMEPIYDRENSRIVGWIYDRGLNNKEIIPSSKLLHLKLPSVRGSQLGVPPTACMILMAEMDMKGDQLNNVVRQRGGVLKAIVGLETPKQDSGLMQLGEVNDDYMKRVQAYIDSAFSGARAGQPVAILENVKGVYPLSDVGSLENNYMKSKEQIGKMFASALGIPPQLISVMATPGIQYIPGSIHNSMLQSLDKEIGATLSRVDDFFTAEIFWKLLNNRSVRLQASGRFSALTLAAAQSIEILARSGFQPTHNECRSRIAGWEEVPPEDPRFNLVLDNSANRNAESAPTPKIETVSDIEEMKSAMANALEDMRAQLSAELKSVMSSLRSQ